MCMKKINITFKRVVVTSRRRENGMEAKEYTEVSILAVMLWCIKKDPINHKGLYKCSLYILYI